MKGNFFWTKKIHHGGRDTCESEVHKHGSWWSGVRNEYVWLKTTIFHDRIFRESWMGLLL